MQHHTFGDLIDGTVIPLLCSSRLQGSVTHIKHDDNFKDELSARLRWRDAPNQASTKTDTDAGCVTGVVVLSRKCSMIKEDFIEMQRMLRIQLHLQI